MRQGAARVVGRVAKIADARLRLRRRRAARARSSGASTPSASRISRVTSPPSARPRGLAHHRPDQRPDRLRVARRAPARAASGSAAIARATIVARARRRRRARPGRARATIARGVAAVCDAARPAPRAAAADGQRARGDHRRRARASAAGSHAASRPGPRHRSAPTSSPPIQLARRRALGAVGGERALEEVAQLARGTRAGGRARRCRPSSRSKRSARAAGSSRHAGAGGGEHRRRWSRSAPGRAPGSSGSRAPPPWSAASVSAPAAGSKCSVSCSTAPPASRIARWRSISAAIPRSRKRNEFMFFSSVLVPSSLEPAGRSDTFASARSEPSSMLTSLTPSARSVARSSSSHSRACAGERRSGSVTISTSGVPPRLKSTTERSEPWMRPLAPEVDELRGVLLEVHAVDPHAGQLAAAAQRLVVLGDLVALRQVGVEVVLAVEDRARRDLAAEREADHQAEVDRARVDHRQRAGQPEADRAGVGVRRRRRRTARSRRTSSSRSSAGRGSRARSPARRSRSSAAPRCRRSRVARSSAYAALEQPVLAERRARPAGSRPAARAASGGVARPHGIEIAGIPASDIGTVQKSFRYIA